jgi:hypothetical protein
MASPFTFRLDEKTRQRIAKIARRKRLSTSEVIRQAIEAWAERQEPVAAPFELVADLLGVPLYQTHLVGAFPFYTAGILASSSANHPNLSS